MESAHAAADRQSRANRSWRASCPTADSTSIRKGPADISATVKAYFALKLAGLDYDDPRLARARERILALGGIQAANSYVKINLSLFDLYPREHAPSIPPEIMLLGNFIYQMSSWTRAIVIPLAIVHALNPRRPVPAGFRSEGTVLAVKATQLEFRALTATSFTWRNFFLRLDKVFKLWENTARKPSAGEPSAKPSSGCWSAPATPTAWRPSIRP